MLYRGRRRHIYPLYRFMSYYVGRNNMYATNSAGTIKSENLILYAGRDHIPLSTVKTNERNESLFFIGNNENLSVSYSRYRSILASYLGRYVTHGGYIVAPKDMIFPTINEQMIEKFLLDSINFHIQKASRALRYYNKHKWIIFCEVSLQRLARLRDFYNLIHYEVLDQKQKDIVDLIKVSTNICLGESIR